MWDGLPKLRKGFAPNVLMLGVTAPTTTSSTARSTVFVPWATLFVTALNRKKLHRATKRQDVAGAARANRAGLTTSHSPGAKPAPAIQKSQKVFSRAKINSR